LNTLAIISALSLGVAVEEATRVASMISGHFEFTVNVMKKDGHPSHVHIYIATYNFPLIYMGLPT
jgi:hypothetical protein